MSRRGRLRLPLLIAALPLAVAAVCAVLAPHLAPHDPAKSDLSARLRPPVWMARGSAGHLLGPDELGRDILSRLIYGARVSLLVGVVSSLIGGTIGLTLGLLSGYLRGRTDSVVAKLIDVQHAFPFLLFAITVIAVLGPSLRNLLIILALSGWVTYARVVRGQTLSLRDPTSSNRPGAWAAPPGGSSGGISSRTCSRTRWSSERRDRAADRAGVHVVLPGPRGPSAAAPAGACPSPTARST